MDRIVSFISGVKRAAAEVDKATEPPRQQPLPSLHLLRPAPARLPSIGEDFAFATPRATHDGSPLARSLTQRRYSTLSSASAGSDWSSWSSLSDSTGSDRVLPSLTEPSLWRAGTEDEVTAPRDHFKRLSKLSAAHGNRFPMCFPRKVNRNGTTRMVTSIFLDVFPGDTRDASPANRILAHTVTGMGAAECKEDSRKEAARSALRQLCLFSAEACADFSSQDAEEAIPHIRKLFRSVVRHIFSMQVSVEVHEAQRYPGRKLFQAEITLYPRKARRHRARNEPGAVVFSDAAATREVAARLGLHAGFEWAANVLDN